MKHKHRNRSVRFATVGACLGAAAAGWSVSAQNAGSDADRFQQLENENKALRARLDALEASVGKDGASTNGMSKTLKFLSDSTLSGYVTASYFYDSTRSPSGVHPAGYLWSRNNSFTLNEVGVTLEKLAKRDGSVFDAGYHVEMIWGDDSFYVNSTRDPHIGPTGAPAGTPIQGLEGLRQAYVDLNIPIGTGLDVRAGQMASLLNFESGQGAAANVNASQGNQWYFTGNPPGTGVQMSYDVTQAVELTARVQNGMFTGEADGNGFKTFLGSVGVKPDSKTSLSFIGFGGREGANDSVWLKGGSFIGNRLICEKCNLNLATEFDYFSADKLAGGTTDWWSVGGWLWTDFTPKFGVAFRGDYIHDPNGAGTSGLLNFPVVPGQDLSSLTLTFNIRPVPNVKFQPEIRYDHTSLGNSPIGYGFGTLRNRMIIGAALSYLF